MRGKTPETERFGGPGSSHQDSDHPGKNKQPTGHKGGADMSPPAPGEPTNSRNSRISGGGGERDLHHTHDPRTKS
ncbi:MAG TPA: hypothetical protein VGC80_05875 [Acetobacteraceae bacterium]|jgi:hypothetical protein